MAILMKTKGNEVRLSQVQKRTNHRLIKAVIAALCLMLINVDCFAEDQIPASQFVQKLSAYDQSIFVYIAPGFPSTQGCTNGGNTTVSIDTSNEHGANLYAAVLAAASAGRQVGFGVNGCHSERPKVYRVDIDFR